MADQDLFPNAEAARRHLVGAAWATGAPVTVMDPSSIGGGRLSRELLNTVVGVADVRGRLAAPPRDPEFVAKALARFCWLMAGNDRLSDIEFYWENGLGRLSDDGLSLPGSDFGQRMIRPMPGVNQLDGVLDRLRKDPASRRAAITFYQPIDAVRDSRDIPCALSLTFHVRRQRLHSTLVMRSSNLWALFPYNFFEFSLLAELVARELGVEAGPFHAFIESAHVYEKDAAAIEAYLSGATRPPLPFPAMPAQPLAPLATVLRLESRLRRVAADPQALLAWMDESRALGEYWGGILAALGDWAHRKVTGAPASPLAPHVPAWLRQDPRGGS